MLLRREGLDPERRNKCGVGQVVQLRNEGCKSTVRRKAEIRQKNKAGARTLDCSYRGSLISRRGIGLTRLSFAQVIIGSVKTLVVANGE